MMTSSHNGKVNWSFKLCKKRNKIGEMEVFAKQRSDSGVGAHSQCCSKQSTATYLGADVPVHRKILTGLICNVVSSCALVNE